MKDQETSNNGIFRKRREFLYLFVALALIAILANFRSAPRGIATISGLSLEESRKSVESKLGKPNFNSTVTQGPVTVEYWSTQDRPQLNVTYDENNKVRKLERGTPEINGMPVQDADISTLKALLGPPSHGGQGRAIGGESHSFLAYPNHNLLVQSDAGRNTFILFRSNRK